MNTAINKQPAAGQVGTEAHDSPPGTISEKFAAARNEVAGKLGEAKSRLDEARQSATRMARRTAESADTYARSNPWKVVGAAAAAGCIIGFIVSRR
jgi:ElaB/YqjD/DUF883 family membrane-anchored ribosome-binding protein